MARRYHDTMKRRRLERIVRLRAVVFAVQGQNVSPVSVGFASCDDLSSNKCSQRCGCTALAGRDVQADAYPTSGGAAVVCRATVACGHEPGPAMRDWTRPVDCIVGNLRKSAVAA